MLIYAPKCYCTSLRVCHLHLSSDFIKGKNLNKISIKATTNMCKTVSTVTVYQLTLIQFLIQDFLSYKTTCQTKKMRVEQTTTYN